MTRQDRMWTALAAASGFLAVALGAFAAHGVADPQAKEWLRLGSQYQIVHALAVLAAVAIGRLAGRGAGVTATLFLAGAVLFSGSLYAMALGGPRWLGAVTPLGGAAFLAGWVCLGWSALRSRQAEA
ncbi:DUF423 domain-containing protein [Caulobacter sp. CCUG 60055]|uniref:DUF423 domain-containing protein n=1 Tax=Caulobacter sp. CCUG 60055 TaxID=2100090 RepID=UPI00325AD076